MPLVDEDGNPINPTTAARTKAGQLVDENGIPLSHDAVAKTTRERIHADLIAAGARPHGGSTKPSEDTSAGDVFRAVGRGVAGAVKGAFSFAQSIDPPDDPEDYADFVDAQDQQRRNDTTVQTRLRDNLPLVGEPIAEVMKPGVAYSQNRAPTRTENLSAVESGSALAVLAAAPAVSKRVAAILKARGVSPEAVKPQIEPETTAAPEATEVQSAPESAAAVKPEPTEAQLQGSSERNSVPIPAPGAVLDQAKRLAPIKEMVDAVAPASASPEAQATADIIRESKAKIANAASLEKYGNRDVVKQFDKAGKDSNISNISTYEKTGQFADAPAGYSEKFKESMDWAHDTLQEAYGDDRVGYVENYVRRAFKFDSEADAQKGAAALSNYAASLSANKSPLKNRVLTVPLDEALADMRARGIKVEPATTNPELLRQWSVENANQALTYKQAWTDAKDANLIQFVKPGERLPEGLVPLDDRAAQVFFPSDAGMVQGGRYYADASVARIFNNTISKGLGGSPTFRGIRAINNAYNQMQLGFSGFHLTGTAINAGISDLSLGMQQILQGDLGAGGKSLARAATPGLSFTRDMLNGREFIKDLLEKDPDAQKVLEERLNPAGARLGVDASYRNAAYEKMTAAWRDRRVVAAVGHLPFAIAEKAAAPLMEYAIPRVKIGAFMDLAEAQLQKLGPAATPEMRQRVLAQAWDSIDNRFGQLTHDNLFWNKTARDLAQVSTRSVGWNLGTIRELGGGTVDALTGKVTPRVLYSAALPIYAGTIGAIFMYLHTGRMPSELKDYFYPQNGLKDNRGRPDRSSLPTYMKDAYAYSSHPVLTVEHKASPLLSMTVDLATNRDYFGDMIRNPDDDAVQQWQQVGKYALGQFRPLSVQQTTQSMAEGASVEQVVEPFFGFTKSPSEIRMTDAEREGNRQRRKMRNQQQMERRDKRQKNP
jgi:hypothetical protein